MTARGHAMRLLMLPRFGNLGASSRLRMLQYVAPFSSAGIDSTVSSLLDSEYVEEMYAGRISVWRVLRAYVRRALQLSSASQYDAIWLEKEIFPWLPAWIESLFLPRGTPVVVDFDDAIFHRYDAHRLSIVRRLLGRKIDAVMRRADIVTAGNEYIAEHARSAGAKRVEWVPTVVNLSRYQIFPRTGSDGEVVIGWIGSPATAEYLKILTIPLQELRTTTSIRCVAIGARPDQLVGTPFEAWEWTEDTEVEMIHRFDIGVMPLHDAAWERGKCGYKLIQYMACGLPVVASPIGVNCEIVAQGVNGYLASAPGEWTAALRSLAGDSGKRLAMGVAGRHSVETTYSVQSQAGRLVDLFRNLDSRRSFPCAD